MNKQFRRGFSRGTSCSVWFMVSVRLATLTLEYITTEGSWGFPAALAVISAVIVACLILDARSRADDKN